VWLEGDGWLGDISGKNVRGDGDPPGHDLGQLVRLLVLSVGHVVELDAVDLVFEGSHGLAVRFHLIVVTARIFHDLVNHELRIPPHVEALDACLMAILRPQRRALYSAMLFDAGK
jgi:predicted histidine transporter YuiF (NhaC family)